MTIRKNDLSSAWELFTRIRNWGVEQMVLAALGISGGVLSCSWGGWEACAPVRQSAEERCFGKFASAMVTSEPDKTWWERRGLETAVGGRWKSEKFC